MKPQTLDLAILELRKPLKVKKASFIQIRKWVARGRGGKKVDFLVILEEKTTD